MKKICLFFVLLVLLVFSSCKKKENKKDFKVSYEFEGKIISSFTVKEEETIKVNFPIDLSNDELSDLYGIKEINNFECDGIKYNKNDEVKITKDYNFIINYEPITYDIHFYFNGKEFSSQTVKANEIITLPKVEYSSLTFFGWKDDNQITYNICNGEYKCVYPFYKTFTAVYSGVTADMYAESISLPFAITEDLELPKGNDKISVTWELPKNEISEYSYIDDFVLKVKQTDHDFFVQLKGIVFDGECYSNVNKFIQVLRLSDEEILRQYLEEYQFDDKIVNNYVNIKKSFSTNYCDIETIWESLDERYCSNTGKILDYPLEAKTISLKLTLKMNDAEVSKVYNVDLPVLSFEERIDSAKNLISINELILGDINLPTSFDYGIIGEWESLNEDIITSEGKIVKFNDYYKVTLKLTLKIDEEYLKGENMTKEYYYEVVVNEKPHQKIIYPSIDDAETIENLVNNKGRLELAEGKLEGTYVSKEIKTIDFESAVFTYAATSSETATIELLVSVKVNNNWSKFLSYCPGGWGLGLQNKGVDSSDSVAKLSTDEVITQSGSASSFKFKLILRRKTTFDISPSLSLVAAALSSKNYVKYDYSIANLEKEVFYDVPKLYQGAVPSIGNSICSATSTTMLLNYKGLSFKDKDSLYEHRYIASIVRDYGNKIYGNWAYNTITMGAYGFDAFVERMYSLEELINHLAYVGPVALSVKGQMTSDKKSYNTSGHLLLAVGYKIENNKITIISNDPNVPEVLCNYDSSIIQNTWRGITYVIK